MKTFLFDQDDAIKYGVDCAIILYNFRFWAKSNYANEINTHDGKTWTFNSVKALVKLFPFFSEDQIHRIMKKLCGEEGPLIKGNYNQTLYDRTLWYAFNDESFFKPKNSKIEEKSQSQNRDMHSAKSRNGFRNTAEPIPDINPDINKEKQEKESPSPSTDCSSFKEKECEILELEEANPSDCLPFSFSKKDWKKIYDSVKQLVSSMEEFRKIALYMHESDFWSARIHKPEDVIKHFKTAAGQALDEIRKQEIIQKRKQYAASRAFNGPNGGCFVDDEKISFISGQVTKTYSFRADNEFWNSQGLGFRQK